MNIARSKTYGTQNREEIVSEEEEKGMWKSRTTFEKVLIVAVSLLCAIVISLSVSLGVIRNQKESTIDNGFSICKTQECQTAAQRIKSSMNESASPCDDFYEYACGGWMRKTTIPDDKGSWGTFDDLRLQLAKDTIYLLEQASPGKPEGAVEQARSFFQLCVDTENATKGEANADMMSIVNELGGAPFIKNTTYHNSSENWMMRVAKARQMLDVSLFMSLKVGPDEKNPDRYIIYLDQPESFGLDQNYLKDMKQSTKYVDAYKSYIRSTLCLVNDESSCPDNYQENEISKMIDSESRIAILTKNQDARRDANALYVNMTISQLQENTTKVPMNWTDFFNEILNSTNQRVNENTTIVVNEMEFLQNLIETVNDDDPTTIANYIAWRFLQTVGPYSSNEFRANEFQFKKVTAGIQKPVAVKESCFDVANQFFGFAVGALYVKQNFSGDAKTDVVQMENDLVNAFRKILQENTWMDENTKKYAELKLSQMVPMIAYPDWMANTQELNKYYQYLNSSLVDENFIESYMKVQQSTINHDLEKLGQKTNRTYDWNTAPAIVNAFYSPEANSITFPAGILQPPFYQHNTLKSLNFGGIGHVIGHEITHGFDDQGSEFNGVGKLESWWTEETKKKFNEKKECFVDEYGKHSVQIDANETLHLNGNQTIGENIADNGGVREAYKAYISSGEGDIRLPGLENLEHRKLFFLSVANIWCSKYRPESLKYRINNDPHSPGPIRATIPLSNTEEFSEVFKCKTGTEMNPEKKCVLW